MSMFDIPKGYETKMTIVRAVYELLEEGRTIESATVTEICERAHVSRKTFYKHFEDKYKVLEWYYAVLLQRSDVTQIGRTVTCEQGLRSALDVYYAERDFLGKAFVVSDDYESVFSFSVRWTADGMRETIVDFYNTELTPDLAFEIDLCSKMLAIAVADWMEHGFTYSPEQLTDYLIGCVPPRLRALLDGAVAPVSD